MLYSPVSHLLHLRLGRCTDAGGNIFGRPEYFKIDYTLG